MDWKVWEYCEMDWIESNFLCINSIQDTMHRVESNGLETDWKQMNWIGQWAKAKAKAEAKPIESNGLDWIGLNQIQLDWPL